MKKKIYCDFEYYTFDSFDSTGIIKHAFTSKKGGFSKGNYFSLNMSYKDLEPRETTLKNFEKVTNILGIDKENVVFANQKHNLNIKKVTCNDRGNGLIRKNTFEDVDALITNEKNVCLVTFHADCTPIYLFDPVTPAIGLVHSGWKGTRGKLARKTVHEMQSCFGSKPKDILAGIGPSICRDCFEVDSPVADEFTNPNWEEFIRKKTKESETKYYIDLKKINRQILIESGVPNDNISDSELCTKCLNDEFYSHRVLGFDRGNMAAMIELI